MASLISRRLTTSSPVLAAIRLTPAAPATPSPITFVRTINSSTSQRMGQSSGMSGAGNNEEDSFAEMLSFGHQLRWQPHPYVRAMPDSENPNLCRGSEDTVRQVHLREDNHQPTILRQ